MVFLAINIGKDNTNPGHANDCPSLIPRMFTLISCSRCILTPAVIWNTPKVIMTPDPLMTEHKNNKYIQKKYILS
jgi:hypothetical protein